MKPVELKKIKKSFIKADDHIQPGIACLASVINYYSGEVDVQTLVENSRGAANQISLFGLSHAAKKEGFKAGGVKTDIESLKKVNIPLIVHISRDSKNEDFIVLYGWNNNKFVIGDPRWGIIELREKELDKVWFSKTLLYLEPEKLLEEIKRKKKLKRIWFSQFLENYKRLIVFLGVLGAVCGGLIVTAAVLFSKTKFFHSTAENVRSDFGVLLVLIPLVLFVALLLLSLKLKWLGIKSILEDISQMVNKQLIYSGNYKNDFRKKNIFPVSGLGYKFGNSVFQLAVRTPFYTVLILGVLTTLFLYSSISGVLILIVIIGTLFLIWLHQKEISDKFELSNKSYIDGKELLHEKLNSDQFRIKMDKNTIQKEISEIYGFETAKEINWTGLESKIRFRIIAVFIAALIFMVLIYSFNGNGISLIASLIGLLVVAGIIKLSYKLIQASSSFNMLYRILGDVSFALESNDRSDAGVELSEINVLQISDLKFAYPGKTMLLNIVNLTAEKGKINVIFGESGKGKSALFSILNRSLSANEGNIYIDDIDWNAFSNDQWRNYISSVFQPVQLHNDSILNHIDSDSKTINREKIILFCKKTGFDEFFNKLQDGYYTESNHLSSGEKQLVSLASAIYKNPKILFMDEPFAFLDNQMKVFCWELFNALKSKMLLVIFTSNNALINKADQKIYL